MRSNGSDEVDGALALLNLEACMKHINWGNLFLQFELTLSLFSVIIFKWLQNASLL